MWEDKSPIRPLDGKGSISRGQQKKRKEERYDAAGGGGQTADAKEHPKSKFNYSLL